MDCSLLGSSIHGIFQAKSWSGLPFPSPGDLPNPGIEPGSPAFQADALTSEPPGKPQGYTLNTKLTRQSFRLEEPTAMVNTASQGMAEESWSAMLTGI